MKITLPTLVFIVFLILKLAGIGVVATWSWLWVTCPLWIGFAVLGGCALLAAVVALLVGGAAAVLKRK
jgi:hypothetical protein